MIRAFLEKVGILQKKRGTSPKSATKHSPIIIERKKHGISRSEISANALKVLNRLNQHGYAAYLVGGGVRDLLLGLHPKDFDVATNATPEEVRRVFRNCRLIGRRFRLAHVYFGYDIVEVATFRGKTLPSTEESTHSEQGMILRDNVYGSLEEDAWRRDFTLNALYYNIADFSIVDYTGGFADLKAKRIRMIGDAAERYREDPVRMLRAIRFSCKTNFELTKELTQPIHELKELLSHVSSARLFEEMIKLFHSGNSIKGYDLLKRHGLFPFLFPLTHESLQHPHYPIDKFLKIVFENTDKRINQEKSVTPAFIVAALLWYPLCSRADQLIEKGAPFYTARTDAMEEVLGQQLKRLSMPKRISQRVRDIWMLQVRFPKRHGKYAHALLGDPSFRAAFDFLELRVQAGEPVGELFQWWKDFQEADEAHRQHMIHSLAPSKGKKNNRRRKRRKQTPPQTTSS